ncbi:type I-MYXAN CRISPR-associated protein Cmx8 [bacterium]|nr:type I-MYXAN CRISPR-associated protein Cmx8 [bacterium]
MTKTTQELTIHYNLYDLPSAQHKAGLAGLLVLIESLRRSGVENLPQCVEGPNATGVTLKFTEESLRELYDEFFAPIELEVPDGKNKTKSKQFPRARFLETIGMPPPWLKLWRDVIRDVIRAGAPAQFKPYVDRSDSAKPPATWDWQKTWNELQKDKPTSLSASDYLGAQASTADKIPFKDRAQTAFLLTFAPIVSLPFISRLLKRTSKAGEAVFRFQRNAYVVATPEVSYLDEFVDQYPRLLASLSPNTIGNNPLPAQASVSIPEEAGLEFLTLHLVTEGVNKFPIASCVSGIVVTQLQYGKGSPHYLHMGTLYETGSVLDEYNAIREQSWNYLYREMRLRNLLARLPWHAGADQLFGEYPAEVFLHRQGYPPLYFGRDVQLKFKLINNNLKQVKGDLSMIDDGPDQELAARVYWLTQTYVNHRTAERCDGMTWDDYLKKKGDLAKYRKAREKVCLETFLALRGRDDQDIVSYVVGTLCSVPQNLNQQQYLHISQQLLTDPLKVKTLAMLALSAHSFLWDGTDESKKKTQESAQ